MTGGVSESGGLTMAGAVTSPPLVLVHGSVVSRRIWLPQLRGLSDDFRVLAPDLPGHGDRASEPFTFAAAARVVGDVIREHTGGRAVVAGLSLGGYVAIELAHRDPALLTGLVLTGCGVNFRGALGLYLRTVAWAMRRGWLREDRRKMEARTRRLFPPALADVADAQIAAGLYGAPLAAAFGEMVGRDFSGMLDGFPSPLLILNGQRDRIPVRAAQTFARGARHREVQTVSGAGHACNLDRVDAYNRALRDFMRRANSG